MVDVTHDGHDRRPGLEVVLVALVLAVGEVEGLEQLAVLVLRADDLDDVVHLAAEQLERLVADRLGGGDHLTEVEQRLHQRRPGWRRSSRRSRSATRRGPAGWSRRCRAATARRRRPAPACSSYSWRVLPLRLAAALAAHRRDDRTRRQHRRADRDGHRRHRRRDDRGSRRRRRRVRHRRRRRHRHRRRGSYRHRRRRRHRGAPPAPAPGRGHRDRAAARRDAAGGRAPPAPAGRGGMLPGEATTPGAARRAAARRAGAPADAESAARPAAPRRTGCCRRAGCARPAWRARGRAADRASRPGRAGRRRGRCLRRRRGQPRGAGGRRRRRGRRGAAGAGLGAGGLGAGRRRGVRALAAAALAGAPLPLRADLLRRGLAAAERLTQSTRDGRLDRRRRGFDEFALFAQPGEDFLAGDTEFLGQLVYAGLACHYISCLEATAVVGRASGLAMTHGHRDFTVCSCSSLPVLLPGGRARALQAPVLDHRGCVR